MPALVKDRQLQHLKDGASLSGRQRLASRWVYPRIKHLGVAPTGAAKLLPGADYCPKKTLSLGSSRPSLQGGRVNTLAGLNRRGAAIGFGFHPNCWQDQ